MTDIAQAIRISGKISEMVGVVLAPIADTMATENWAGQYQAIFWQAIARDAMVRSVAASRAERDAKGKPVRGAPDDG